MWVSRKIIVAVFFCGLMIGGGYFYLKNRQTVKGYKNQINVLKEEFIALQIEFTTLKGATSAEKYDLKEEIIELNSEYEQLNSKYSSLNAEHLSLQNQYKDLTRALGSYQDNYQKLINKVNVRLAFNEYYPNFITPNDPEIENLVYQLTSGWEDKEDINELWKERKTIFDWVTSNIEYAVDSPYPYLSPHLGANISWSKQSTRFPNETISYGTGDCEDQAVLLLSMIISHDEGTYDNWLIGWKSSDTRHMAVAFPVAGKRLVLLDPAGQYHSGSAGSLVSEPVEEAIGNWLENWDETEIFIDFICSKDFYEEFDSTAEFLNWYLNIY